MRHLLSTNMREEAFNLAAPTTGLIRCTIKRVKAFFGGTTFQVCGMIESGHGGL